MDNSVRATESDFFINQGGVIVEDHNKLKNDLINIEKIRATRNSVHHLIHTTLKISVLNVKVVRQIRTPDVDRRITSSIMVRNWKIRKINFTGTQKGLKRVRIDQQNR